MICMVASTTGSCPMLAFKTKGAFDFIQFKILHREAEDILAVTGRAFGRVAVAAQATGLQPDGAGQHQFVLPAVGQEIFGFALFKSRISGGEIGPVVVFRVAGGRSGREETMNLNPPFCAAPSTDIQAATMGIVL